jgi:hypothetical protein
VTVFRAPVHRRAALAAGSLALAAAPALALTPAEVFDKVSPSIWAVRALDAQERPIGFGSAVVVGAGQLVTRCLVLARARSLQLRRENTLFEARLEHADVERDLCILSASNFSAPAVPTAPFDAVKVGQRVYVIGTPERLAATLSEGLVAGVRNEDGKPALQTTAPLSAGLSGGGVFDERGKLVGIAAFGAGRAPSASFAAPAEWIAEVVGRSKEQLARRNERPAAAAAGTPQAGLPAAGATWRYSFRDRQYSSASRVFTVRVSSVQGSEVRESFSVENGPESSAIVDAGSIRFSARRLTSDYAALELAPYFYSSERWKDAAAPRPAAYPGVAWEIGPAQVQPEDVSVPAGTFKAMRVDVRGSTGGHGSAGISASANHIPARFHFTGWYAPEVGRYVMTRHQTFNFNNAQIGDEMVQLLEYRSK